MDDPLDDNEIIRHTHRTNVGMVISIAAQIGKFVLGFGGMMVFARTVSPEDFGIFSIAIVVFSFGNLCKDGLALAVVQCHELNSEQQDSLFWINQIIGVSVALITVICALTLPSLYKAPVLMPLLFGLSFVQLVVFLGNFQVALLRRQMRFGNLGAIEQVSTFIAMFVAIVVAFRGGGIWTLFVAYALTVMGTAIGAMLVSGWRPKAFLIHPDVVELFSYGKRVTASDIATFVTRNTDRLLIGSFFGATPLGFYDRAYNIMQLPMVQLLGPIGSVAHSSLSKTITAAPEQYKSDAKNVTSLMAAVGMFLSAYLFVCADSLIPVVLGNNWLPSILLLQLLAPSAYIDSAVMGMSILLLSSACTREYLALKILAAVVGIIAICAGLSAGPLGVAICFSCSRLFVFGYGLYLCNRSTLLSWKSFCRALRPSLLASVAAFAVVFIGNFTKLGASLSALPLLIVQTVAFVFVFRIIWGFDPDGRERIFALRSFFKDRFRFFQPFSGR